jgi:serine/threonine protein kinase
VIPRRVRFIDASVFKNTELSSISIEIGNERFVIREDLLMDIVDHKLIRNFSSSSFVVIPRDIEILCSDCCCTRFSLESVSFDVESRLTRIESEAFPRLRSPMTIPSTVLFVAHNASPMPSQLTLCDEDSCPEFGRWRQLRQSGIAVDFRRIVRGGECALARLPLDLTAVEEGSMIGEPSGLYRCAENGMEIVVKAFDVSEFDSGEIENEIENLSNLRHPLIAAPIGIAFWEGEGKLKIGRLHGAGGSLAEAISSNPVWWTPTAKAEAVVGIALALRFAHGLGLLHGDLNSGNLLFDGGGRIQIADFHPMRRGERALIHLYR